MDARAISLSVPVNPELQSGLVVKILLVIVVEDSGVVAAHITEKAVAVAVAATAEALGEGVKSGIQMEVEEVEVSVKPPPAASKHGVGTTMEMASCPSQDQWVTTAEAGKGIC